MDGAVDIKLLVTLGGIIVSMAGAAAVAKSQIQRLTEMLKDMEARMRAYDNRTDRIENTVSTNEQRLNVIAKMMSPEVMERRARESATVLARLEVLERTQNKIEGRVGLNGSNK
mgnify:CR=1 FL=1|tara:strand:+ start:145 stop:486 length:342 start_codon:yes stop_codon:yes gene_type:complete